MGSSTMRRVHGVVLFYVDFFGLYGIALSEKVAPLTDYQRFLVKASPWWLLVSATAYSMISVGIALITFKECRTSTSSSRRKSWRQEPTWRSAALSLPRRLQ